MIPVHKLSGQAKLAEMIARPPGPVEGRPIGPPTPDWLAHYLTIAHDRLLLATESLAEHLEPNSRILDVGGNHFMQEVMEATLQQPLDYQWTNHLGFDLRTQPIPHPDASFDVVICWETIEHLWTIRDDGVVSWDGVFHAMQEMRRVLRPGGVFHLTTTNRVCPRAFQNYLAGATAQINHLTWGGQGHVREFSGPELVKVATETGFKIRTLTSFNSYNKHFSRREAVKARPAMEKAFGRPLAEHEFFDTLLLLAFNEG